jgi:hypothetical protein
VDKYGFTKQERYTWSTTVLEYVTHGTNIKVLTRLRFENGVVIFNPNELIFFEKINFVINDIFQLWDVSLLLLFIIALFAWIGDWLPALRQGISYGGWLSVGLIAALSIGMVFLDPSKIIGMLTNSQVHSFSEADTTIRLFPFELWRDLILWLALMIGGSGILLGFSSENLKDRSNQLSDLREQ